MAKVGYTAVKNIAERFKPLSRVQQRYRRQTTDRQTTDDRRIYDSKHPNVMYSQDRVKSDRTSLQNKQGIYRHQTLPRYRNDMLADR